MHIHTHLTKNSANVDNSQDNPPKTSLKTVVDTWSLLGLATGRWTGVTYANRKEGKTKGTVVTEKAGF